MDSLFDLALLEGVAAASGVDADAFSLLYRDILPAQRAPATHGGGFVSVGDSDAPTGCLVKGLPWWTNDLDVEKALQALSISDIGAIEFMEHRVNGKSCGTVLVRFHTPAAAVKCSEELTSYTDMYGTVPLTVELTRETTLRQVAKKTRGKAAAEKNVMPPGMPQITSANVAMMAQRPELADAINAVAGRRLPPEMIAHLLRAQHDQQQQQMQAAAQAAGAPPLPPTPAPTAGAGAPLQASTPNVLAHNQLDILKSLGVGGGAGGVNPAALAGLKRSLEGATDPLAKRPAR